MNRLAGAVNRLATRNGGRARGLLYQALCVAALVALAAFVVSNATTNLAERQIRTGFDFLGQQAGFDIGEALIAYRPSDSHARAFLVGILNTLRVAAVGVVLATLLGIAIGMARLSRNWLVARLATVYVELLRNVPLLLQLFLWYGLITGVFPVGRDSFNPLPGVYLGAGGLKFPLPEYHPVQIQAAIAALLGIAAAVVWRRFALRRRRATGREEPRLWPALALALGPPLLVYLLAGAPLTLDMPSWQRFRYVGGGEMTPEFLALLIGLVTYTASYIGEIVRAGIQGVDRGQAEAARVLGLSHGQSFRLVVFPQALRIIVPPLTSQYLNLTKNSSLAVAVGYPDMVSIANTSLNQTGQAIEMIALFMAVYLVISLAISAVMNRFNRRIALVER